MEKLTVFVIVLISLLMLSGHQNVYADDPPPLMTPTPGASPFGSNKMPIPVIGTKEEIIAQFNIPSAAEMRADSKIDFTWDINNWILWAQASKAGMTYAEMATWGAFTVIIILLIVLAIISAIADSVYSAGYEGAVQTKTYVTTAIKDIVRKSD